MKSNDLSALVNELKAENERLTMFNTAFAETITKLNEVIKFEKGLNANFPLVGYTAVDMTTAAAQGFRDGQASVVVELPPPRYLPGSTFPLLHVDEVKAAIISAGGSMKE